MTRLTLRARITAAATAGVLVLAAAGCGSSSKTTSSNTSATTAMSSKTTTGGTMAMSGSGSKASMHAEVQIVNFMFKPMSVTIKVGGTVTWKQVDSVGHSVESSSKPPAWTTSPVMKPGQTFSHTFTKAGTYNYICGVHNYMMGKVVVTG